MRDRHQLRMKLTIPQKKVMLYLRMKEHARCLKSDNLKIRYKILKNRVLRLLLKIEDLNKISKRASKATKGNQSVES